MELCKYPSAEAIRCYEIEAIEIPIVYNRFGDHDPDGLVYVLKKDADRINPGPGGWIRKQEKNWKAGCLLIFIIRIGRHFGSIRFFSMTSWKSGIKTGIRPETLIRGWFQPLQVSVTAPSPCATGCR